MSNAEVPSMKPETDKDKGAAFFDAVHNRFGPLGSGFDITRSDPAFDSLGLELMANRVCYRLVLGGMADKDFGLHGISAAPEF